MLDELTKSLNGFINIEFSMDCSISDEPDSRFMTSYSGAITFSDYDEEPIDEFDDEGKVVGNISLFVFDLKGRRDEGYSLFDIFDLRSETVDFYCALVDEETGLFKEELTEQYMFDEDSYLCILNRLEIEPAYRGRGIGLIANELAIQKIGYGCDLIALKAFPLQFEQGKRKINDGNYVEFSKTEDDALSKLCSYYAKAGFVNIDNHIMVRKVDINPDL